MKSKKPYFFTLAIAVFLFTGQGCKQTTTTENANNANQQSVNQETLPQTNSLNTNTAAPTNNSSGSSNTNTPTQAQISARALSDVEKIARFFTEYFGSYSTDSNYGNITGLKIYMTPGMQQWADGYVQSAKAEQSKTAGYFGVTTKAVSTNVDSFSDAEGKALITVSTQRRESTGTSSNARIYYQDMVVSFTKDKNVWKVNEAKWK